MSNYYFLATLLPELQVGLPPQLSLSDIEPLLIENLSSSDYATLKRLRHLYDIENLRTLWLGGHFLPTGNYTKEELLEAIETRENLPRYILEFLDTYPDTPSRITHFAALLAAYYREEAANTSRFAKWYLTFERHLRLVGVGFRAKQLGKDL